MDGIAIFHISTGSLNAGTARRSRRGVLRLSQRRTAERAYYLNGRRDVMTYVDGFVAAVPTANREIYKKHAEAAAVVFKEHGALKLVECWGDDVPNGKLTSFPMAVKRQEDETFVFSCILWPSREVRD